MTLPQQVNTRGGKVGIIMALKCELSNGKVTLGVQWYDYFPSGALDARWRNCPPPSEAQT